MSVLRAVSSVSYADHITTIGPEAVWNLFDFRPTIKDRRYFEKIRLATGLLDACRDTHILTANVECSINALQCREGFASLIDVGDDKSYKNFIEVVGKPAWLLFRKRPIDGSAARPFGEQNLLLPRKDAMPTAQELVCATLACYGVTGEHLFNDIFVRTASFATYANINHVVVGVIESRVRILDTVRDDDRGCAWGGKWYPIHAVSCRSPWTMA